MIIIITILRTLEKLAIRRKNLYLMKMKMIMMTKNNELEYDHDEYLFMAFESSFKMMR